MARTGSIVFANLAVLFAVAVVVGGAITRPQQITQRFSDAINHLC